MEDALDDIFTEDVNKMNNEKDLEEENKSIHNIELKGNTIKYQNKIFFIIIMLLNMDQK